MKTKAPTARIGHSQIRGHFLPEVVKAFRKLAYQKGFKHQLLLAEALNDLFEKYGMERLADEKALPRGRAKSSLGGANCIAYAIITVLHGHRACGDRFPLNKNRPLRTRFLKTMNKPDMADFLPPLQSEILACIFGEVMSSAMSLTGLLQHGRARSKCVSRNNCMWLRG